MKDEKTTLIVTKASGHNGPFSILILSNSLSWAKTTKDEIVLIVETLLPKLYHGISTQIIYSESFRLLRHHSKNHATRYYLKRNIMELGPSGFPLCKANDAIF